MCTHITADCLNQRKVIKEQTKINEKKTEKKTMLLYSRLGFVWIDTIGGQRETEDCFFGEAGGAVIGQFI